MSFSAVRSVVLFVVGIVGIVYETIGRQGERPTLLILFAALVGLPAFLHFDERNGSKKGGES